ncbi:hypothetical protein [Duganella sp. HH101]|uniref:hypothetical protein n=1 Tax=Duganella sp. HH101 TaxID=1781066 RepID=UPI000893A2CC|nr:hypothetical protein [Duganella sp. HH101]OFA00175.1 hypothetical protein DUGA2_50080 [Duganella sp. HH101]
MPFANIALKLLIATVGILTAASSSFAGVTATYTGSAFTSGQTGYGLMTASVTFVDGFQPKFVWSNWTDIQSLTIGIANGPSLSYQSPSSNSGIAQFSFNSSGEIDRWWVGLGFYPSPYTVYSGTDFTTYRNGADGPAAWDFAILPGQGNAAWNSVSTGTWTQSALLIPSAVPQPVSYAMLLAGLGLIGALCKAPRCKEV